MASVPLVLTTWFSAINRDLRGCRFSLSCLQAGLSRLTGTLTTLDSTREELADRTSALAAATVQIDALNVSSRMLEQRNASLQAERATMTESLKVVCACLQRPCCRCCPVFAVSAHTMLSCRIGLRLMITVCFCLADHPYGIGGSGGSGKRRDDDHCQSENAVGAHKGAV